MSRKTRVLVAKPGLDGHDVGAKLVCRALMEAGMEVIYTGLRQSAEAIARAALEESVDVVGLSILSGAHVPLTRKVKEALDAQKIGDVTLVVGGNIPRADQAALEAIGVAKVFPTGSGFDEIVDFVAHAAERRSA
jgi:methylmalonyl-CoA mutase C-terminal domain/subunit